MDAALISAMDEAGAKMATGELFIPEVLVAADAMKAAMDVITPHLDVEAAGGRGTVVIGAVEGDVHDIGKSLVALMLDGAGFTRPRPRRGRAPSRPSSPRRGSTTPTSSPCRR